MTSTLRVLAVAIAAAGVIDPALPWRGGRPSQVDIRLPAPSDPSYGRARETRDRLVGALGSSVNVEPTAQPDAVVAIGTATVKDDPGAPVFALSLADPSGVRIIGLHAPDTVVGQRSEIVAQLQARGLEGATSRIELQQQGVVVQSVTHEWTSSDEHFEVRLSPILPRAGLHRIRVVVRTDDRPEAAADAGIAVRDRSLRVLAYDPRPSWGATFVRRALEADPLFEVSALARTSRGISAAAGDPPRAIAAERLQAFDAILVGAPEAVRDQEWTALLQYVTARGGRLVVLPDRQVPSAVRTRLGLGTLEEVLVARPMTVTSGGLQARASELLLPRNAAGIQALATVTHANVERPAVLAVPHGEGTVIFVGTLDAWRFRGDSDAQPGALWRALVADAAAAAPAAVAVRVHPAIARPGDEVTVIVQVRGSELEGERGTIRVPSVKASLISADGDRQMIRLWPSGRAGHFEGRLVPDRPGRFTVTAATGAGATANAMLGVDADVVHPAGANVTSAAFAAAATGGGEFADVSSLAARLAALGGSSREERVRPLRSPWTVVAFVALLALEWTARRRAGLR